MLSVENLHVHYGNIHALKGVTLRVNEHEIVTIVGSNGAGKSTMLRALSGVVRPSRGRILLDGEEATFRSSAWWVRRGVVHCPEARQVFPRMSVLENLEMGAFLRRDREIGRDLERVYEHFPVLRDRRRQPAGTLSGGEQQMLAIGRALMASPRLLLLDEPSLGLSPVLVQRMFAVIEEIRRGGTTVLLVEQNAHMAFQIADRGYVLETGVVALEGSSDALLASDDVRKAYLGEV